MKFILGVRCVDCRIAETALVDRDSVKTVINYMHCSYLLIKIAYFSMNNDMVRIASQTNRKVSPSFLMWALAFLYNLLYKLFEMWEIQDCKVFSWVTIIEAFQEIIWK